MTLLDLQRRIREAGRIRIGQQVATQRGGKRPAKLDTFRLTSPDRRAIEGAAELYGGEPSRWQAPAGPQWEVVTTSDELHVIIPPSEMAFSQFYELWSGGGCQRRCDSVTEQITDGPCICDADARECKPHTRLSVMLRDLPGLGVWRLDTQGIYAAQELASAVEIVKMAAGAGVMLPARLRLEQRQIKRPGEATRNFAVPVLDLEVTPAQLLGGRGGGFALSTGEVAAAPALSPPTPDTQALPAGESPAPTPPQPPAPPEQPAAPPARGNLQPVPSTVKERPVGTVADQMAAEKQQRRSQAQPIPRTGLAPRTAEQAEAKAAPPRTSDPEGVEPVDELQLLTVAKLKLRCRDAGLPVSGSKDELVDRLRGVPASGSTTVQHGETAPPDDEPDAGQDIGYDRDGAQKAFHARIRDLGLDYATQVKPWMLGQYGESLSGISDQQLHRLLSAMEERPEPFVASVEEHEAAGVADDGEASAAPADTNGGDQPSLSERALAHAEGRSQSIPKLQDRIRRAWAVLAVHNATVYEAGWERARRIIGRDPSDADWSGASESKLGALASDMEKAAAAAEAAS